MSKLTHVEKRIIVKIPMEYKNSWTFEDGTKIALQRFYDNFNERYTRPINAIVISAENIEAGSQILVHHTCTHETNRIHNYKQLSGNDEASDIKYFSIREDEAFAWYDKNKSEWRPLPGFDFALRIFRPYTGVLENIQPTLIKNHLFMLTGKHIGKVGITIQASDYQVIFQNINGREGNLIRVRTDGDEATQREPEIVALHNIYTNEVLDHKLYVGLTKEDAKPLNEYINETVH